MHAPLPPAKAPPSIALLVFAALLSQLVAGMVLCLAIAWSAVHAVVVVEVIVAGSIGLVGILAAGMAIRGRVVPLMIAGVIDAAIAGVSLARRGVLADLDRVQDWIELDRVALGHAAAGALAAVLCACAIPQARRYAAWQLAQLERAIAAKRL